MVDHRTVTHGKAGRRACPGARMIAATFLALFVWCAGAQTLYSQQAGLVPQVWKSEWPKTDFGKRTIDPAEIKSVIAKDRIPAIDKPTFVPVDKASLTAKAPVIAVTINGDARAYPLSVLIWHEIVNDTVGDVPVAVTFCPLCNSAIVFDRRLEGRILSFGTTGKLRKSDLVMYDRQTESWWQQFVGQGLIGTMAGKTLKKLPMRMESFARFKARNPQGKVLRPPLPARRPYGRNPYARYDSSTRPFLYRGKLPVGIPPLERVVVVGQEAWSFSLLRKRKIIRAGDLILRWESGQHSALDAPLIADGRDVGTAWVQRRLADGKLVDAVFDVSFAFAFHAFYPNGKIHGLTVD